MLLPPGQKHFTVYVVSSLFGSVSVLYAVLKNSDCNRSSYFTLKWSSFTTATLYLLWLYLRYTQSHLAGLIYFFQFRRQIFLGFVQGLKHLKSAFSRLTVLRLTELLTWPVWIFLWSFKEEFCGAGGMSFFWIYLINHGLSSSTPSRLSLISLRLDISDGKTFDWRNWGSLELSTNNSSTVVSDIDKIITLLSLLKDQLKRRIFRNEKDAFLCV